MSKFFLLKAFLKMLVCHFLNESDVFSRAQLIQKWSRLIKRMKKLNLRLSRRFRRLKKKRFVGTSDLFRNKKRMKLFQTILFVSAFGEIPVIVTKDAIEKYAKSWNMQVDKSHSSSYEIMGRCQKKDEF